MISSKFQNEVKHEGQEPEPEFNGRATAGLMHRSQLEIRMDMLRAVKEGAESPTQIMYKANLSWITLQQHLKSLVSNSCLREEEIRSRMRYELTEKGLSIMMSYEGLLNEVGTPRAGEHAYRTAIMRPIFH